MISHVVNFVFNNILYYEKALFKLFGNSNSFLEFLAKGTKKKNRGELDMSWLCFSIVFRMFYDKMIKNNYIAKLMTYC